MTTQPFDIIIQDRLFNKQSWMFSRFKELVKNNEEEGEANKKKAVDVSFLPTKEIEEYKKNLTEIQKAIQEIYQISIDDKESIKEYIKDQQQRKNNRQKVSANTEGQPQQEEQFTLPEDLDEIKELLKDIISKLSKIQLSNEQIKEKVKSIGGTQSPQKSKELIQQIKKYETEIKALRNSDDNYKEIMTTLRQQTELLSKQTKSLQQKNMKLDKQLAQKTQLILNIQEQRNLLLQMRNVESKATNPQVENLKNQLSQLQKKLSVEKTKLQQKQKQIETLKKKLEEDRDSLQKIADELKQKELKSKKIIDKYERSKTQIRKYRQQKTEFIKKLNMEIASLSQKVQTLETKNNELVNQAKLFAEKNERLEAQTTKNEGKGLELESARSELKQLRQQQLQLISKSQQKEKLAENLKAQVDQLQLKRKSLLQALQKPINHEIKTLDKIIRALEKLYKDYIEVVFTQGNIIGFENKISYILSNVCQIKQDLKL